MAEQIARNADLVGRSNGPERRPGVADVVGRDAYSPPPHRVARQYRSES
jgi:hypothetical protein